MSWLRLREVSSGGPCRESQTPVTAKRSKTMVIGCGNLSRTDDAIGHRIIDVLETKLRPSAGVVLLKTCQLDVTLAGQIVSQDLVVFVDAAVVCDVNEEVCVVPLVVEPAPPSHLASHTLTPKDLLAITGWLYGRVPKAMLVAVSGYDFSFGGSLTAAAEGLVPAATSAILKVLRDFDRTFMS